MAGSWEIANQPRVLVATLSVDTTTVAWGLGLRRLIIPNGDVTAVAGMPYDHARNQCCRTCLDHGFTHLFFLDSDVVCPPDTILRLLAHHKPIIGGVYYRRCQPLGVPVMMRRTPDGMLGWVQNYPLNTIIEVDVMGSGCCLISRELLIESAKYPQRVGKTWYDWRVDLQGTGAYPPGECLSEDYTFHSHIKKVLGVPILVDTGVQCRHIGYAESHLNQQLQPEFVPCHAI